MPESKRFLVTQTRQVKVTANSALDAGRIAQNAFLNGQNSDGGVIDGPEGVWGNTASRIEVTDLHISREN